LEQINDDDYDELRRARLVQGLVTFSGCTFPALSAGHPAVGGWNKYWWWFRVDHCVEWNCELFVAVGPVTARILCYCMLA